MSRSTSTTQKPSPQLPEQIPTQERCSLTLRNWMEDDALDHSIWKFNFPSEMKTCQSSIKSYQDYLQKKEEPGSIYSLDQLSQKVSEENREIINPLFSNAAKRCPTLTVEQQKQAKIRLYLNGKTTATVNSTLMEQMAFIDSVLPSNSGLLSDIECTNIFPKNHKSCDLLKREMNSCKSNPDQRLSSLVEQTIEIIPQIERLTNFHQECVNSIVGSQKMTGLNGLKQDQIRIQETCDPILEVIDRFESEIPWVRGEVFRKKLIREKENPAKGLYFPKFDLTHAAVREAISEQLSLNRVALKEKYNKNLKDFGCLTNAKVGEACDYKEIRSRQLENMKAAQFLNSQNLSKDSQINKFFEAEQCLLERHEDREQTMKKANMAVSGTTLTLSFAALGGFVSLLRMGAPVGKISYFRYSIASIPLSMQAYVLSESTQNAIQNCRAPVANELSIQSATSIGEPGEIVCGNKNAAREQAKVKENNCVLSVAMAAATTALAAPSLARAGYEIASLVKFKTSLPANADQTIEIIHWNSKGHFDLLIKGKMYGSDPSVTRWPSTMSKRMFDNLAKFSPGTSTVRFKIKVTDDELLAIQKDAERLTKQTVEAAKATSLSPASFKAALPRAVDIIWKGDGMMCSASVCGYISDATGFFVPRIIREIPHLMDAYLRLRMKLPKNSRIVSIETSGKFDWSSYVKSRDFKDNVGIAAIVGGGGATSLIIKYIDDEGNEKTMEAKTEVQDSEKK